MNTSTLLESGQFLSFLTILGVGFVYVVLGWLLSHVLGDHADAHATDGHDGDYNHETVSLFSPKVVAIFMVGFGAGGCIATNGGLSVMLATLSGLGVGALFGGAGLLFMRALYGQQASSEIPTSAAVGQSATVTSEIPPGGSGEVTLSVNGQHMTYTARLKRDATEPVRRGYTVMVVAAQGSTVIVN